MMRNACAPRRLPYWSKIYTRLFRCVAGGPRLLCRAAGGPRSFSSQPPLAPSDPHVLTTALLFHAASPDAHPVSELMRDLAVLWGDDDPRSRPASPSFLAQFPALFTVAGGKAACVGFTPAAAAHLRASPLGGARVEALLAAGCWPPRAAHLLRATPLQWLPARTFTPDDALFGPLLEELLRDAGGALPVAQLLRRVQAVALERGLPLPQNRGGWFLFSPHPAYARLRPLWKVHGDPRAELTVALSKGSALEEDICALRALAEEVRRKERLGAIEPTVL